MIHAHIQPYPFFIIIVILNYIDYKIKTHHELQLPLTSLVLKNEEKDSILIFKSKDKDIIHLHSTSTMNHFIKFILQNAIYSFGYCIFIGVIFLCCTHFKSFRLSIICIHRTTILNASIAMMNN